MQFVTDRLGRPTLASDFSLLMLGQAGAQLVAAMAGLLIVRALPPHEYGRYVLTLTTVGLAGVGVDFGLNAILSRATAQQSAEASGLLSDVSLLRLLAAIFAVGLATALAALWSGFGEPLLLVVAGLALAPRGLLRALSASWLGLRRAGRAALLDGVVGMAVPLAALAIALSSGRALPVLIAISLMTALLAALSSQLIGAQFGRPVLSRWPTLLKAGAPLALAGLAGMAFHALDLYVVGWLIGSQHLAAYAAPFRIVTLAMVPPTVWGVVALPRFAAQAGDVVTLRRNLRQWLPRLALAGFTVCATVTLTAPLLVKVALGPAYIDSIALLMMLIWMSFFVYLSAPYIAILTALDHQLRIAAAVLGAGLVAISLNIVLAPRLGLMGVAAIKVGSMGLLLGFYIVLARIVLRRVVVENRSR